MPELSTPEVVERFRRWYHNQRGRAQDVVVSATAAPGGGYSNDLLFAAVEVVGQAGVERESLVVRLAPAGPPLFPDYDLEMQVVVQREAAMARVPVAHPIRLEPDPSWLGRPFLVMPHVAGRHPGDVPMHAEWLMGLAVDEQRRLHTNFLDVLADIHTMPYREGLLPGVLRGASAGLAAEVAWWERYVEWACEGLDPTALVKLFEWCRAHLPRDEPPTSVLWGDARLGNVVVGDELGLSAVLDWEMAALGPAESDLAWFSALSSMTERFVGTRVPGFLDRDEIIAYHGRRLGRSMQDMEWHEAFAIARSAAVSVRTAIVAAAIVSETPPDPATNPVVRYAGRFTAQ